MRKTSAVLATLSLAVLALTGCTAAPTFDGAACDRSVDANGVSDAVTITGDFGAEPDVEVFAPVHVTKSSFTDVIVGEGRPLVNDTQLMMAELSLYSGETGKAIFTSPYDEASASLANIEAWSSQSPGLATALQCATEGSRVVAALTPEDFGAETAQSLGVARDEAVIFVIDVVDVFLSKAEGALQFNDARNIPTVVRAADGTPGVIIPDGAAPTAQVEQTLIKGDGEPVQAEQTPLVNFTAVGWDDKTVISTTWGATPSTNIASTVPQVAEALVGKTVGSQILVVTPAAEGAPAVAYVVDILGAVTAPAQ